MFAIKNFSWVLPVALLLIGNSTQALKKDWVPEEIESVCNTDDLNHSKLVECNQTRCNEVVQVENPPTVQNEGKVLHMFSSRSGSRFNTNLLNDLNYVQSEYEKTMDINTTLYVETTKSKHRDIYGFGTTIDLGTILNSIDDEANLEAMIRQLFSQKSEGLRLSFLRVTINRETLLEGKVMRVLTKVDNVLDKALGDGVKVKLVLSFDYWPTSNVVGDITALQTISFESLNLLKCWAVALPYSSSDSFVAEGLMDFIQDRCCETKNLFMYVPMNTAAQYVNGLPKGIKGLLIQSDFSSSYSNIDQAFGLKSDLAIMTIGSPKPLVGDYGNWQTAQHHAVEIMNHLKHDSSGFLEATSIIDVFSGGQQNQDSSIYNLGPQYEAYFKGPIFYALGHFSKHVKPGSRRLDAGISTQPNMFAANFMSLMTADNHVVTIVLNDNEHDLPFRLAIDGRIRAHVMLETKSFNTLVIKP